MIAIDKCLISDDIIDECFCCNLECCHGKCCIDGDYGAPLEEDEVSLLEDNIDKIYPYMTAKGIIVVKEQGVFVHGIYGDFETPLIDGKDCAYLYYTDDGNYKSKIAKCSIETAYKDKIINFNKPISCHLYPIRLSYYGETIALNYDRWPICKDAVKTGKTNNIRIYQFLKEPLIRRFGEEWYKKLLNNI